MIDLKGIDWSIFLAAFTLVLLGLIMIYSSSAINAWRMVGQTPYFFYRQLLWSFLGLLGCFTMAVLPQKLIKRASFPFYIIVLFLLVAVLFPQIGFATRGSRRWIDLGFLRFQPSELAKLSVLLLGSLYLTNIERFDRQVFRNILALCLIAGIPAGMVIFQPDLSSSIQIFSMGIILLILVGIAYRHLFAMFTVFAPVLGIVIFISGYRRARILAYINPWGEPLESGYQALHLFRSLASGGFWGRGLGSNVYRFLPEPFTDSIVAVVGEELGFVGVLFIIIVVFFILYRGIVVSLQNRDPYFQILGVGLSSLIGLQAAMNLSVVIGLLPTTGVTMPFISYGGTSLLLNLLVIGLLLNISRRRQL